jgi:sugar/nucleoside kinase (ribokinase family)
MDLVTVGDVMLDVVVDAPALVRGGDVHGRVSVRPGGTSANASVWAANDGARVRIHGRVGDDVQGRVLRRALAERGVEDGLTADRGATTGTMLVVTQEGERSMVADRGANARLVPGDLPSTIEAGAVLVSGYLVLHEGSRPAGLAALDRARARFVAIDAASWPLIEARGGARFAEETSAANAIFANEREAEVLTGETGEAAARALGERSRLACVKRGNRGALMAFEGSFLREPGEPVVEVDSTGAGDAFDGVLLAALVRGALPQEALRRACRAGARVAASAGGWPEEDR